MADGYAPVKLVSETFRVDSGVQLPGEGALEVAVEIFTPAGLGPAPTALVCIPGGGMTRRYFDLLVPNSDDDSFSFARQMARRGFIVVLIDSLGVGESTRPADGYALTADLVAQANAQATDAALDRLRERHPDLRSIGVGHSMGALLTVVQQARYAQHAAIAVLGFSTRGLPEYLSAEAKALVADREALLREVPRLAKAMFREPYPSIGRTSDGSQLYAGLHAEAAGVQAIKPAREKLLPVPAFHSMLPGNVAPEAAAVEVPVFVGLGELDIAGPPADAPKAFTASQNVQLKVWPKTGHSHFIFAGRAALYDDLAAWANSLSGRA